MLCKTSAIGFDLKEKHHRNFFNKFVAVRVTKFKKEIKK